MLLDSPRDEFIRRLERARAAMQGAGITGLLLTAEANINYFTGYRHFCPWTTFTRPVVLLVPAQAPPVLLVQGFLVADAARDCWFDDVRGYDSLTGLPVDHVVALLAERGMSSGSVGAELGYE